MMWSLLINLLLLTSLLYKNKNMDIGEKWKYDDFVM